MKGISILICTYNGAHRLPETLRHAAAQQVAPGLAWEVLLVSNASTDDTLACAARLWEELGAPAPLRLFDEPRPGKENALILGFDEAQYEAICVVDDDNWLYPDYLTQAAALMAAHPEIGILGGCAEGAFEVTPPEWLKSFAAVYAIGPQAPQPGPMRYTAAYLYGAGSVVRRSGWRHLRANGFAFTTAMKRGAVLANGEDVELGNCMRLAGYDLWYDPRLRFRHFMYKERLTWDYLMRIGLGTARSGVHGTVYDFIIRYPTRTISQFRQWYFARLGYLVLQLSKMPAQVLEYRRHPADPAHPATFETMRRLEQVRACWSRRAEVMQIFRQAKALQQRLQANPAPIGRPVSLPQ